jgi:hypothetical protein
MQFLFSYKHSGINFITTSTDLLFSRKNAEAIHLNALIEKEDDFL